MEYNEEDSQIIGKIYKLHSKIGSGAFGIVLKAIDTETNKFVALKKIQIQNNPYSKKQILREILLLKGLQNEQLISLNDVLINNENRTNYIIFIMEFIPFNLRTFMKKNYNLMTNERIKLFMYKIFLGLAYLHHNDIIHRDLKPDNILVNIENEIKIADFGWARKLAQSDESFTKEICNIHYRAPEICLKTDNQGPSVDIWAAGCIFYELIDGNGVLFQQTNNVDLLRCIFNAFGSPNEQDLEFVSHKSKVEIINFTIKEGIAQKNYPSNYLKNENIEIKAKDLFNKCLEFNPRRRITALQALKHPYFEGLYSESQVQKEMIKHSSKIDFSFEQIDNIDDLTLLQRINEESKSFKKKKRKSIWSFFD